MLNDNCGSLQKDMLSYLEKVHRDGVELFVDGQELGPEEVVRRCVREDSEYMSDYVLGEEGTLEQLRFDKVDPE